MSLPTKSKQRLKKLIVFMEALPRAANKHFYMGSYLSHSRVDHEHSAPRSSKELLHSCGTTACALGWAATMPHFQKLGMGFTKGGTLKGAGVIVSTSTWKWGELFGGWNEDQTPKQWAKRARGLLAEWSARD